MIGTVKTKARQLARQKGQNKDTKTKSNDKDTGKGKDQDECNDNDNDDDDDDDDNDKDKGENLFQHRGYVCVQRRDLDKRKDTDTQLFQRVEGYVCAPKT